MMAFLLSPVGRWIAGGALAVALLGGVYVKGRGDGSAACQARVRAAVDAERERQRRVTEQAVTDAMERQRLAESEAAEAQARAERYEASLRDRPVCGLTQDDVEGLQ